MEILFLAHRAPFPPDRGDRIRSFHILQYLARHATVNLVAFVDTVDELAVPAQYRALLGECHLVHRDKSRAWAAVEALALRRPVSLTAFADRAVAAAVRRVLRTRPVDAIYVFSGQMAQYLPDETRARTIMDFVDLDSAKFKGYARTAHAPMRWMMAREARLLAAFEQRTAQRCDARLFVSAAEAALLPGSGVLENGIDTARYDPAGVAPIADDAPLIMFTGQMDYPPNVEAVTWFARAVLPAIDPRARFAIVGRAPTAAVRALASPRVIVTGEVADVRPWLAGAAAMVAPLRLARGIQNKILEAMAMARPVVATPAAAEGIDHAGTIHVADGSADFAQALNAILADPIAADIAARAARVRAITRYGWDARLAPLDDLLGLRARAAA